MSKFYIMKAHHLTTSGRKLGLKEIVRDEPDCTILVARRSHGWNKEIPCFIIGSAGDYSIKKGDSSTYTIDTGNGYGASGDLEIDDVLQVRNGKIVVKAGEAFPEAHKAAYTWVMK